MLEQVSFDSDGLKLAGVVHRPDDMKPGEKRPAFLVLHGFGTSKNGGTPIIISEMLESWGYVALRFDYRGCGDSAVRPDRGFGRDDVRARKVLIDETTRTGGLLTYQPGLAPEVA